VERITQRFLSLLIYQAVVIIDIKHCAVQLTVSKTNVSELANIRKLFLEENNFQFIRNKVMMAGPILILLRLMEQGPATVRMSNREVQPDKVPCRNIHPKAYTYERII
jgi:hypothetical protein